MSLIAACCDDGRNAQASPSIEAERACVQAFKKQAGQNRMETWKALKPLLTKRLASVPKTKTALKGFFEQWLGHSEREALERSEDAVVWALSPEPNRGDVLAYQLSSEKNSFEDLVIDFRNPDKVEMGIVADYAPTPKKGPHDQISRKEKQIAAELNATEINLGGGSLDGSAKTGFWVQLEGAQASEGNVRKAAQLTTLVGLRLTGTGVTDACLLPLQGHPYLATLDLYSTSVSDAGLAHLAGLNALKWLTIDGGGVTQQGVNALRSALPKCEVKLQKRKS